MHLRRWTETSDFIIQNKYVIFKTVSVGCSVSVMRRLMENWYQENGDIVVTKHHDVVNPLKSVYKSNIEEFGDVV